MVGELHSRVNDALALDDNLNLILRQAEEPGSLDKLKALIHQSSGINGDLGTHVPVGVLEGVGFGLSAQFFGLHAKERAAGRGEQNFLQRFGAGGILQALENGAMLAVHGQQLDAVLFDGVGDKVATGDKALFVGKGQVMAALDRSQRSGQTGDADNSVQHDVGAIHGSQFTQTFGTLQQLGGIGLTSQRGGKFFVGSRVHHGHVPGVELMDLSQQFIHAGIGSQTEHGIPVHAGNVQALGADGAGRA